MVTLVIGLPGSGKTYFAKELAAATGAVLFDDPASDDLKDIVSALGTGRDVVIVDTHLCNSYSLAKAVEAVTFYTSSIDLIFFENDSAAAIKNNSLRNDGRVISSAFIRTLSKHYYIPSDAKVRPVFSQE